MSNKLLATLLLVLTFAGLATAGIITRPTKTTGGTSYTDGTIPHDSDLNGDVDTVYTLVNGNIEDANIKAGAAISASKISPNFAANVQVTTAAAPCFVNINSALGADLKQWRICQDGSGVLSISTYTDAGAVIITPLSIARATGIITTSGGLVVGNGLTVSAGGIAVTGGIQTSDLTAKSFLYSGTAGLFTTTSAPTNGQLLIGSTGNNPVLGTIAGTSTHICNTNGAGTITIDFCATPALNAAVLTNSTVAADPTAALGIASKQYVDTLTNLVSHTSTTTIAASTRTALMSSASFTLNLNTAVGNIGKQITFIHNGNSLVQVYTIDPAGAETADGTPTYALYTNGERLTLVSNGSNWIVLDHQAKTDWVDAGPISINGTTSDPTKPTTPDIDKVYWKRDGSTVYLRYILQVSSAAGSAAGSGSYLFSLPTNIAFDTTILTPVGTALTVALRSEASSSFLPSSAIADVDSTTYSVLALYAYDITRFQAWRSDLADSLGSGAAALTNAELAYNFELNARAANWRQ